MTEQTMTGGMRKLQAKLDLRPMLLLAVMYVFIAFIAYGIIGSL